MELKNIQMDFKNQIHTHLYGTVKPVLSGYSQKDQKLVFKNNRKHSAKILTFIKLPFFIKFFVLSVFDWSF